MKNIKKIIKASLIIIILPLFILATSFIKHHWTFSSNVTDSVCLQQVFLTSIFNLKSCWSDDVLIQDVEGWIIERNFIYGATGANQFFSIETSGDKLFDRKMFRSMGELNTDLHSRGLTHYDLSREENVAHLKYKDIGRKY